MSAPLFSWDELRAITGGDWLVAPTSDGGIDGIHMDGQTIVPGQLFLAYRGERHDSHRFLGQALDHGASAAIVSQEVAAAERARLVAGGIPCLRVADTLTAYHALALAHRRRFPKLKVVAITGSSGKTSTKEIVASIARAAFPEAVLATEGNTNNLVGVPRNLLRLNASHRVAVIELGTSLPGEIAALVRLAEPDIAVLSSIGPVHLEGLGSLEGVAREKAAIFAPLAASGGWAVLPRPLLDNPLVAAALPAGRVLTAGREPDADLRLTYGGGSLEGSTFVAQRGAGTPVTVAWSLLGEHQAQNAGLGLLVGELLGIPLATAANALAACRLPGMRMQVAERDAIRWINDAYNANAASMRALIDWLAATAVPPPGRLFLCLGDMLELGDHSHALHLEILRHARAALPTAILLPVGQAMGAAAAELGIAPAHADPLVARAALHAAIRPGDTVALKASRGMALERLL